jgi:N-acetylneuraminic acid mutarotase
MHVPKLKTSGVLMLGGILAALLLTAPASAANWKTMAALPVPTGYAAAESINGVIYVAGGANGSNKNSALQSFNPETQTWTLLSSMPLTLYQGDGAGVINSQLYVAGGWNGPLPTSTLLRYDPPSNLWTSLPGMSHLTACGATGVIDSKLYVTTACNGYNGYSNYLDVYDPVANAWTSLAGSASAHAAPALAAINGKLYVAGGLDGNGNLTKVLEVFNPATNAWTTLAPMPTAVVNAASVSLHHPGLRSLQKQVEGSRVPPSPCQRLQRSSCLRLSIYGVRRRQRHNEPVFRIRRFDSLTRPGPRAD